MIFLKILLWIVIIILLILIIICMSSVVTKISFWNGKLQWCVKYLGIQILPLKKKPKFLNKSGKMKKKSKPEQKKSKDFFIDKFLKLLQKIVNTADIASNAVSALPNLLHKFARAIKWCNIKTNIIIGDEDAYDCAKKYSLVQIGLQNLLALLDVFTQVKRKQILISCDFTKDDSCYNISFECRVHVGKSLIAIICFLLEYLKNSKKAEAEILNKKL